MSRALTAAAFGHTGQGDYGHGHEFSLGLHPEIETVAIADPDPEGRARALARTGAPRGYEDYRDLLERERPDLVSVASRTVTEHAVQIAACAQSGVKGVLCEKPMAASLAEADRLLAACRKADMHLVVAHRRASAYEIHAYELVRQGRIGQLREIRGRGKGDHRAGGEDLAVLGPHIMDSMRWFAGADPMWADGHVVQDGQPVVATDARAGNEGIGAIAGNGLTGTFMFPGGLPAVFTSYAVAPRSAREHSQWFGFEIYGTEGALSVRNSPTGLLYHCPRGMCAPGPQAEWNRILLADWEEDGQGRPRTERDKMLRSNRIMVDELVNAVRDGAPVTRACTGEDARWALEMIMAIHESHLQGQRVELPLAQRNNPYSARTQPEA